MSTQPTAVSESTEVDKSAVLRTDIEALKKTTHVLEPFTPPKSWLNPPIHDPNLPSLSASNPDPNNVLLLVPTENEDKVRVVKDYFTRKTLHVPEHVNFPLPEPLRVTAESQVGEQPYDSAGPEGAFNRVVNAVRQLQRDPTYQKLLDDHRIGTVVVGSVENFMLRINDPDGKGTVPVDYGFVVLCRIPVVRSTATVGWGGQSWEWRTGISRGVTVPVDYWTEAERAGFDDDREATREARRRFGKMTVGTLLARYAGLSSANWHEQLAEVSRYDLLAEAMANMEAPWPASAAEK
ncbi:hypothetical protein N657DRAFT_639736 [Parathielavia appendiculata]|uniref:Uncharacterized protein n=1 Tax=Parathielavia appendiculata TaxID=2587402 RepID=A0AAN6Z8T3_9PEZI|nr:hypothetical protein N657DRAFT_639736 [Parathielavia appendiculata]